MPLHEHSLASFAPALLESVEVTSANSKHRSTSAAYEADHG